MEKSVEQLLYDAAHAERADAQAEQYRDGENDLARIDAAEARAVLFEGMADAMLRERRQARERILAEHRPEASVDVSDGAPSLALTAPDIKFEPEGVAIVHVMIERVECLWRVTAKRGLEAQVCQGDTLPSLVSAAVGAVSVGSQTKPAPQIGWQES